VHDQTVIAILNYNGKKHLETYLPSVIAHSGSTRIAIIDNASTDDSVNFIQLMYPQIELVINTENYGFAGGYNKGLEKIKATCFVLLNSDVEVTPGWLEAPLKMLSKKDVAAVQPKIRSWINREYFEHAGASGGYIDKYGFPFCRGRMFDTAEKDEGQFDNAVEVFWATGACMFVKSDLFFEAGGFDNDFFAHMEEIDLCWRFQLMGYKIMVEPSSVVYHLGGGTLGYMSPFKTRLNFRNSLYLLQKNVQHNRFGILFRRLSWDGIAGIRFLLHGNFSHFWAVLSSHFEFYSHIGINKRKRKLFAGKIKINTRAPLTGMYYKSVVRGYFLKKKKFFRDYDL
jgi:GT2 family glycosyltransferase